MQPCCVYKDTYCSLRCFHILPEDCIPLVGNGGNSGGNRESTNVMATNSYNFKGYNGNNDNSPSVAPSPSSSAQNSESPTPTPSSSAENAEAQTPTSTPSPTMSSESPSPAMSSESPSPAMSSESPTPTPTHPNCSKTRRSRKLATVKNVR